MWELVPALQRHSSSPPTKPPSSTHNPSPKQTNKQNWPSCNSQLQLCVQRELGACFSAPIALSPSRLLSEVWKCTFFHVRICWSLPASGLWAPWGQGQDIHCAFPTSRSRVALPSDRKDSVASQGACSHSEERLASVPWRLLNFTRQSEAERLPGPSTPPPTTLFDSSSSTPFTFLAHLSLLHWGSQTRHFPKSE